MTHLKECQESKESIQASLTDMTVNIKSACVASKTMSPSRVKDLTKILKQIQKKCEKLGMTAEFTF